MDYYFYYGKHYENFKKLNMTKICGWDCPVQIGLPEMGFEILMVYIFTLLFAPYIIERIPEEISDQRSKND